jgi:hypothetical protein
MRTLSGRGTCNGGILLLIPHDDNGLITDFIANSIHFESQFEWDSIRIGIVSLFQIHIMELPLLMADHSRLAPTTCGSRRADMDAVRRGRTQLGPWHAHTAPGALARQSPCHDKPCLFSGFMPGSQPVPGITR